MTNKHPNPDIMSKLIANQWQNHSIYAAIVDSNMNIVAEGITTIDDDCDPTAHAEINAIRNACKKMGITKFPEGYWLYSTFEPCPLCASAIVWAGLDGVVYANNPNYRGDLPNWSFISCKEVLQKASEIHQVELVENYMIDEIKNYFTRHENH